MLMKGDAENLWRLAAMVKLLADELVIVCDDPLSEVLKDTAVQCDARLVPHRWQNDFAAARNAGLEVAEAEWVFWIDSDEMLVSPDASTFRKLLDRPDVLGYYVTIEDVTDSAIMSPRRHPSLYRRRKELRYTGRIHEHFHAPLEWFACKLGLKVPLSPVRLRHTGYQPQTRPEKLRRNITLLELELADRPGQLYYLIELGRSLLLAGQTRGHGVLTEAAQILLSARSQPQPPTPLTAALLEYALSHAPADFPLARSVAVNLYERWFPSSPPLAWHAARWYYEQGQITEAARLLRHVLDLRGEKNYDDSISFNQAIFGDETRLNYGVCCAKLGQTDKAIEQFKFIQPGSPFFAMAQENLKQLADS